MDTNPRRSEEYTLECVICQKTRSHNAFDRGEALWKFFWYDGWALIDDKMYCNECR